MEIVQLILPLSQAMNLAKKTSINSLISCQVDMAKSLLNILIKKIANKIPLNIMTINIT